MPIQGPRHGFRGHQLDFIAPPENPQRFLPNSPSALEKFTPILSSLWVVTIREFLLYVFTLPVLFWVFNYLRCF